MRQGMTLTELAQSIEGARARKRDLVVDTRSLELVEPGGGGVRLRGTDDLAGELAISDLAHTQLAERIKVPARYYRRMLESAPTLLAENVNWWLAHEPEARLLRTLLPGPSGGPATLRAFLSDRYRRIDYELVAEAALPVLADGGADLRVESCSVTETRLYIKAVTSRLEATVAGVGDVVQSGVMISNSEVGLGAVRVEPLVYTLRCKNGMVVAEAGLRRHHVGRRVSPEEELESAYSDETLAADDRALMLKVRDVVRAALEDREAFEAVVARLSAAATGVPVERPVPAVRVLGQRLALTEAEGEGVLAHLLAGGDLTRYGVHAAVTRFAQEEALSYDRATELERAGWQVVDLPEDQWQEVARAA